MSKCHIVFIVIETLLLFKQCQSDVFTALVHLEDLLDTEQVLINTIEKYIKAVEQNIDSLRKYVKLYQKQQNQAKQDPERYLSNPIHAYILIKRLTADLSQVKSLIGSNITEETLSNISNYKENLKFPTNQDLNGAALAVTRLQDTYRLATASLARGELNGVKSSSGLTASDCFELGKQSYNDENFYRAQLWMQEAEARLKTEDNGMVDRSVLLEYLAFSAHKQGNIDLALNVTNKLLEMIPGHNRALGNRVYYEDQLKKNEESVPVKNKWDDAFGHVETTTWVSKYQDSYEYLCRGERAPPVEVQAKLKCRYVTRGNPFLLIAPFKVEEAYLDPDILIYHDVMSDREIETLKAMARPKFQRATVLSGGASGGQEVASYRTSESSWFADDEHKYVADISQRVIDMTGLNVVSSEKLQIVNYGIGGHYDAHYDFELKREDNEPSVFPTGNRIATVLFYMSDVLQGGATAFPAIDAVVWPKKGTAVFWHNLFPSGDGDSRTVHAACPVLAGSKWVSNKWLHEQGQEFLRPCTKERPPEELTV